MQPADLLFTNGPVFTGAATPPVVMDVAVRGAQIAAVGEQARELRGSKTEVVDVAGRLLLPGFQDAHCHPTQGGAERLHCDLSELDDLAAYQETIAGYAAQHQDTPWVIGGGWQLAAFPGGTPRKEDLDAIVSDRPAYLPNRDHHGGWVNSRALELAGITRETPDPADGRIERDADGEPTGTLHEGAVALLFKVLPEESPAERLAALLEGQRHLLAHGVTAWQDAIVGAYLGHADPYDTYVDAAASADLVARVRGALWWERERGLEQLPELVARRDGARHGRFVAGSVKIMLDGIAENFTAAMLDPYLDGGGNVTGNRGISFVEAKQLDTYVTALDAAGFQVHVHAIGDRAVRIALDAFEAARAANGPSTHRHHLAHLQVVHPADVPRFASLEVTATVQALWAHHEPQMDELTIPFLGNGRAAWQYPFGDLHRSGAAIAMGSDWPVTSPDPWQAVHVAVNRAAYSEDSEPFLPHQALDLATALAAYTSGSARVNHLDDSGRISPGYVADLAVATADPFALPVSEIGSVNTARTYVGGALVHDE